MKIGTAEIIRNIDVYCIENLGIPGIVLMEKAAEKVVENLNIDQNNSFVVVCGSGNNGGDGLAVARQLYNLDKHVQVFMFGINNLSKDCSINYNILRNMGFKINIISGLEDIEHLREVINKSDITIDAIFGTGLKRKIEGIYDLAITVINENSLNTVAIDVPSGFDSNSGKILGNCIKADKTITFQLYKRGFLKYDTDSYTGKIIVKDIGIPNIAINKNHNNEFMVDHSMIKSKIKPRNKYAHKGTYGRVAIIGGGRGFTGASVISTLAAVRSGAGLVTLCCPADIQGVVSSKLLEAMTLNYENTDKLSRLLDKSNAIAVGPGMGNTENTLKMLSFVLKNSKCPVIIDADAINVLEGNLNLLKNNNSMTILTPHFGEMSRLTGLTIKEIEENRVDIAKRFAKENEIVLVLKGYNTIITDGEKTFINTTGSSSMASGGMGDCLTGIISSFVAQGYEPLDASYIATFLHGYCGDKLAQNMYCVNAAHVIEEIPYSIKEILNL